MDNPSDVNQEAWSIATRDGILDELIDDIVFSVSFDGTSFEQRSKLYTFVASAITAAVAAEREAIIEACKEQQTLFLSTEYASNQPMGSLSERFAIDECIAAIRNRAPSC